MKTFKEFGNETELKEKETWWGKKGKERVADRRAQWAKQGLLKKKSKPEPPSKKEKDSGIRRAAKKAGMSSRERKGLYNQNDIDERLMSGPQKVAQMQHYWDNLDHMASDERKKKNMQMRFGIKNIKLDNRGRKILSFEESKKQ